LISVTEVETAGDLSSAKVFISVMGSEEDRKAALAALRGATGFFRHMLLPRLRLRRVPDLLFRADTSLERGDRVLGLLKQIAAENEAKEVGTTDAVEESRGEEAPAPRREE
jgi:ribosome-binding factor A